MSLLARTTHSLHQQGLRSTLNKAVTVAADALFDLRHGVETQAWAELRNLTIRGDNQEHGARYQPTHVWPLRRMLRTLQPQFIPGRAFVDLGCGKGRALLLAAECGFPIVRGVEFAHELCTVATANCAAYKRRRRLATQFEILEADVVRHPFAGDENVIFMFNPFAIDVMNRVLDNIAASLAAQPRPLLLLYHNPRLSTAIAQRKPFAPAGTYTFGSSRFAVYQAQP